MHHTTRRLLPSSFIALGAAVAVTLAAGAPAQAAAASAQSNAAEVATASSNAQAGMQYVGTSVRNNVKVTRVNTTFTVDDIVPIQAGAGCQPVTGDATKVTCVAFKTAPNGSFKRFTMFLGQGNDTVVNQTSGATINTTGAPMLAFGNAGTDSLVGDDKVKDELRGGTDIDNLFGLGGGDELDGGSGEDDLDGGSGLDTLRGGSERDELNGGDNDDVLDGGPGADTIDGDKHEFGDTVSYVPRLNDVTVDLNRTDDSQGETGEGDIIREVEHVQGGDGDDTLKGNAANNRLTGSNGDDALRGQEGKDVLLGGFGKDNLLPSPPVGFFGLPTPDGQIDIMDCGTLGLSDPAADIAFRVLADGDFVNDCEQVLDV